MPVIQNVLIASARFRAVLDSTVCLPHLDLDGTWAAPVSLGHDVIGVVESLDQRNGDLFANIIVFSGHPEFLSSDYYDVSIELGSRGNLIGVTFLRRMGPVGAGPTGEAAVVGIRRYCPLEG